MKLITNLFDHSKEYQELKKSVSQRISPILVHGTEINALKWMILKLSEEVKRDILVLFDDDFKAKTASEDSDTFSYLPSREMIWFDTFAHSNQLTHERVETLLKLKSENPTILFTAINNLAVKYPLYEQFKEKVLTVNMDSLLELSQIQKIFFEFGYERVEIVEAKGQYSIRGGIVDIFSTCYDNPIRMEFFGDEIDSIRSFDIETQKSIKKYEGIDIFPCREMLLEAQTVKNAVIKLSQAKANYKAQKRQRVETMIEHLKEGVISDDLDPYFSVLFDQADSLLAYQRDPIVFIISNNQCMMRIKQYIAEYARQFTDFLKRNEVIKEQYGRIFELEQIMLLLKQKTLVLDELLIKKVDQFEPEQIMKITSRELSKYFGKFEQVALEIKKWKLSGYHIVIAIGDSQRKQKFFELMQSYDIAIDQEANYERALSGQAILVAQNLSAGFYFDTFKAVVLTENELYGEGKKITRKRANTGKVIKAFSELSLGDYVVHENHGIGQYVGIEQMKMDLTRKDFLKIKYAQDDFLYIPVESSSMIQKYIGTDHDKLRLNRLGGTEWKKTKQRAQKSIEEMTDELIELYADRKAKRGYAFSRDNDWQREFENMFPYQETRDQLKCIEEIKRDMEVQLPMERLLCGDVGYGKTEVALRAAFKAVLDSKQVAILVPTTILAQQHFNNTVERFSKYPAKIEMLSRFRTKAEQAKIIENIRTGVVDVIIGTHRILSNDIQYKDLGLLIIDEEQRFGVKHKEKIKMIKENIDVLTLSATPIPRTLHMSMIGIRDMSVIEDPPEDRYPIQTYVVEFDEFLVREAIIREIERGGQVFFVHNRVADIDQVAYKINQLVPDAKVDFAHGQMNEHKLEKIMISFMNNEFNVLVCTTIIETGLDIANVNTIIINDGDRFGLSQLYQLRGRVGRSNRLAYCYIFYQVNKVLNEVAEKRLRAIKEFTELGAGFKIAMRDLEIRGAGNVLGTQQHGHMEAVGYDLFCKLLEESIMRKKGEIVSEMPQAKMDIAINAYIPETYIHNHQMKIEIYKKIAAIETRAQFDSVYEEIEDRFGTVSASVNNLMKIAFIKSMVEKMWIEEIAEDGTNFIMKFQVDAQINPLFIGQIVEFEPKNIQFYAGNPMIMKLKITNRLRKKEEQLTMLENFIEKIYSFYCEYSNME
ncbi:transcription-repair coupling factor [Fusibacter sp. 3D3]|uniref:transcription-repair coupling factor n=1 Tax=Fusibacter sp. 3D3 TaxID=1048380 RepID=UPI000852D99D|nr:transcription-repair coupling factor [Fusibacter sp. 3D3]GAU76111.1 transcription-repair coupling factor [Fusibacter sp. 3D3]